MRNLSSIIGFFWQTISVRPEVLIVGIEPKEITYSLDLSPEVREKIRNIVRTIGKLCKGGGK
jgi:Ni,Fe-hydrogenase maturation factor